MALELPLEELLDPGPVVVDDRVPRRVADRIRQNHVLAEDPFECCADTEQRSAHPQITSIGLELDAHRAPGLECVAQ